VRAIECCDNLAVGIGLGIRFSKIVHTKYTSLKLKLWGCSIDC
jgi:hypothetical protein